MHQIIFPELNDDEKFLMFNRTLFPLKYSINEKIIGLFNLVGTALKDNLNSMEPGESIDAQYKIYKGENYQHYPYIVLDYPKLQSDKDIICIRSMFWYGHFFSIALLLTGNRTTVHSETLHQLNAKGDNWSFSTADTPWLHDIEHSSYIKLKHLTPLFIRQHIKKYNYIKVVKKIEGENLTQIYNQYLDSIHEIKLFLSGSSDAL